MKLKLLPNGNFKLTGEFSREELFTAARELAASYHTEKPLLSSPQTVKNFLISYLQGLEIEHFTALFLDTQNQLLHAATLWTGTVDSCTVHPREVVKAALRHNAAAIIFAHNPPSGLADPSPADRQITERLKYTLALVDVRVLDHIVVGAGGQTVSLAERGWI